MLPNICCIIIKKNPQTKKTWLSFEALSGKIELHRTTVWEKKGKTLLLFTPRKGGGKERGEGQKEREKRLNFQGELTAS